MRYRIVHGFRKEVVAGEDKDGDLYYICECLHPESAEIVRKVLEDTGKDFGQLLDKQEAATE